MKQVINTTFIGSLLNILDLNIDTQLLLVKKNNKIVGCIVREASLNNYLWKVIISTSQSTLDNKYEDNYLSNLITKLSKDDYTVVVEE